MHASDVGGERYISFLGVKGLDSRPLFCIRRERFAPSSEHSKSWDVTNIYTYHDRQHGEESPYPQEWRRLPRQSGPRTHGPQRRVSFATDGFEVWC